MEFRINRGKKLAVSERRIGPKKGFFFFFLP